MFYRRFCLYATPVHLKVQQMRRQSGRAASQIIKIGGTVKKKQNEFLEAGTFWGIS